MNKNSTTLMEGRICLVTGGTSGIGKVTALELARMGATVVIAARDPVKGKATVAEIRAASGNRAVDLLLADLSSLGEVHQLVQAFKARYRHVHVLVNNAGTIFPECTTTGDGLDTTYVVNHLAHFLLTNLMLDLLKASAPARIVNIVSATHKYGTINFARLRDPEKRHGLYSGWRAYNQSKLATVLFTYELARRLEGTGVTVNCLHPGLVATNAGNNSPGILWHLINRYRSLLIRFCLSLPHTFLLTPEQGVETTIYLASSPEVEGISGKYFVKKVAVSSSRESYDRSLAYRLWQINAELTGLTLSDPNLDGRTKDYATSN